MAIDRREALKSLAALAGATGISVTPVTTEDATDAAVILLESDRRLSHHEIENLRLTWQFACAGTALEHVKLLVLDSGLHVRIIRGKV